MSKIGFSSCICSCHVGLQELDECTCYHMQARDTEVFVTA